MDADREHRYLLLGGAAVAVVTVLAAVTVPAVYDQFIWKHLAGPIVADALNQTTATFHGVTAHRGYTPASITVYALVLIYGLFTLHRVFDRLDVELDERLVVSLTPFMVFGALARVAEDAALVPYPWNAALISPVIYIMLAALGTALLAGGIYAERRGWVSSYHRLLRLTGGAAAVLLAAILVGTTPPQAAGEATLLLIGAPAAAIVAGLGIQRWLATLKPSTFLDTGIGQLTVAAHLLDGTVTAVIVTVLGGTEKLPLSAWIIDTIHPAAFPAVKLGVVLAILGTVEKDEADTLTSLAFAVLVAVGLGPGTRNLVRALLGV